MKIDTTDSPREEDEAFVVAQTRAFNEAFTTNDVRPLCSFARGPDGAIVGGLTAKTYWNYLDIAFLWVDESHRGAGIGQQLVQSAEAEAFRRGCRFALLDTFSFQARPFYERLGYRQFGQLTGFPGGHVRHYMTKELGRPELTLHAITSQTSR
ncbi:MAG TPA: GNAT family N-acetyltransferase [Ideonella sp.]|uniref:GNAT family N-acetyltransferase n=1 Tax=Ideonella sp. TaxID=1929293 RepID=UPI002E330697|nr:GNAT family N-acetyltransferase [Ideonella sp.]HEX5682917.1 GNAT family N-acetyltransferase [Ideonella sp.]